MLVKMTVMMKMITKLMTMTNLSLLFSAIPSLKALLLTNMMTMTMTMMNDDNSHGNDYKADDNNGNVDKE